MEHFPEMCLVLFSLILSTVADFQNNDQWIAVPWQPPVSYDYYHSDPKIQPDHYHEGYNFRSGYDLKSVPELKPQPGIGYPAVPGDVMVDVINDLGINLLAVHNEHNENNIALSPYGAISVLAALSEGLNGEAVHEILHAAHLPKDRHVVRVGLRDIHRHLKSYFIPPEGFLAGLTLNLSNVTLRTEYEEVLRFYGFDYGSFNNALYPEPPTTQKPSGTTAMLKESTDSLPRATELGTRIGEKSTESTTLKETTIGLTTEKAETTVSTVKATTTTTTTTDAAEKETTAFSRADITEITVSATTPPVSTTTLGLTTTEPSTTTKSEETTTEATTTIITTQETLTTQALTTTEEKETTSPKESSTTLVPTTTEEPTTYLETLETAETATQSTAPPPTSTTMAPSNLTTQISTMLPDSTTPVFEGTTNVLTRSNVDTELNTFGETTTVVPQFFDDSQTTTPFFIGTMPDIPQSTALPPENPPNFDYYNNYQDVNAAPQANVPNYEEINPGLVNNLANAPPNSPEIQPTADFTNNLGKRNARSVREYVQTGYFEGPHRPEDRHYLPEDPKTFSVYGKYREPGINFMKYDTVLPFAFVPNLNALALSFPLDSSRYYLLLLLPAEENGVDQLICDLRLHGSLKYIVNSLRMTHIVATIPSFMLKGYVSLTPTLQKLGIRDIFEPRRADFSPMTEEKNIYVTNVEQAVTVTIRNYLDPSAEHYTNYQQYDPVYFTADHPFLYFVLDSELNVALMVGKVVNPLNSRIR